MDKTTRSPLHAIVIVTLIVVISMVILISSSGIALRIANTSAPQINAAMEVKYELTLFHLWFEELVQQDPTVNREQVWQHLSQARWYANALLKGDKNLEGTFQALDDPTLRSMISETVEQMNRFEAVGLTRLERAQSSLAGSDKDQEFDRVFLDVLKYADDVETAIQLNMTGQVKEFERLITILGMIVILVGLAGSITFFLFERHRRSGYTSLLKSREQLDQESALLNSLIDSIPDLIFYKNPESIYLGCNVAFEDFTGRKKSRIIGHTDLDFFPKKLAEFFREKDRQMLTSGEAQRNEEWVDYPDGRRVLLDTLKTPYLGPEGETLGLIGISRDITARTQAEERLRKSEAELKEAQSLAHIGNWELNPATMKAAWSDEVFRILGIETTDDTGPELLSTLLHPDDRDAVLSSLQLAATGCHQHNMEYRIVRPDGNTRWLSCHAEQVQDINGNILKLRGVIQDITQRKRNEQQMHDSEERYRTIFEGAPEGVWLIGPDRRTIEVNKSLCDILGYQRDEMIGNTPLDFVDEKNREIFIEQTGKITTTEKREYEIELRHKDGHNIPTYFRATTLHNTSGGVLEAVAFVSDLTEQKAAEIALRRAQKMDAVGQLTGGIAHDFNNILGIILGNLSFLQRLVDDDEKALKRVETANKAALRAADLTKQLLGFSRKQAQNSIATNINQVIRGMDSLIIRSITPEVEIEHHLADNLWLTDIDPGDFEGALLNLILNARDAMPGSGKLTIESSNKVLDTAYTKVNPSVIQGEYVQLEVSDTGCGIPADILEHIFEPFFTTKPQGKGTGLGMSMVFGFAQRSGGYVKAYSEPAIGTTIRLYMPRFIGAAEQPKFPENEKAKPAHGREIILVVDDEEDLLELVKTFLEELGYTIVTANNGQQALELLTDNPSIDLLFSDVVMPGGMNGYALAEQAKIIVPELKVLLTSGFTSKAVTRNGQAHFKANLLSKPYRQADLATRVRLVLDEKKG